MSFDDLNEVVECFDENGEEDVKGKEEKVKLIHEVMEDVRRYSFYERTLKLGVRYTRKDLTFVKGMLFSFIGEEVDRGRKVRV